MHIPTYQIHNVIKGYIMHIASDGSFVEKQSFFNHFKGFEDRKDDVLDKTAKDIIERILKLESPEKKETDSDQKSEFVFKTVNNDGNTVKNVLLLKKNSFEVKPFKNARSADK